MSGGGGGDDDVDRVGEVDRGEERVDGTYSGLEHDIIEDIVPVATVSHVRVARRPWAPAMPKASSMSAAALRAGRGGPHA